MVALSNRWRDRGCIWLLRDLEDGLRNPRVATFSCASGGRTPQGRLRCANSGYADCSDLLYFEKSRHSGHPRRPSRLSRLSGHASGLMAGAGRHGGHKSFDRTAGLVLPPPSPSGLSSMGSAAQRRSSFSALVARQPSRRSFAKAVRAAGSVAVRGRCSLAPSLAATERSRLLLRCERRSESQGASEGVFFVFIDEVEEIARSRFRYSVGSRPG